MTVFGLFFMAFAAFWMGTAFSITGALDTDDMTILRIFPFFGLPFFLVGLYICIIRPFRLRAARQNVQYALTEHRVYILQGGKQQRLISFAYEEISNVTLQLEKDDVGTISFHTGAGISSSVRLNRRTIQMNNEALFHIQGARQVYQLMTEQRVHE